MPVAKSPGWIAYALATCWCFKPYSNLNIAYPATWFGGSQFAPGDDVELTRDEPLFFYATIFKQGKKGERYRMAEHRVRDHSFRCLFGDGGRLVRKKVLKRAGAASSAVKVAPGTRLARLGTCVSRSACQAAGSRHPPYAPIPRRTSISVGPVLEFRDFYGDRPPFLQSPARCGGVCRG